MSDSSRLHGLQPTRLLCPWNFPGKNTGVGCHRLLQYLCKPHPSEDTGNFQSFIIALLKVNGKILVAQSCPAHCNPMDCSLAPSSIEFSRQEYWTGLPFTSPGDFPDPQMEPRSPVLQMAILPSEPPEKSQFSIYSKFLPSSLPTAPSQPWPLSEDVNHHHSSWEITAVVSKRPLLLPLFFHNLFSIQYQK